MICIAGKNDIATNVLAFVAEKYGNQEVVAVANRDDTGRPTWQHSLVATAGRLGVRLVSLQEAYELPGLHFFSVEFDRIVVPAKFRADAQLYNIHFSLLPRYKGVYTAVMPLLHGEAETGVTLHRMEAGIDTGPVIHQARLPIGLPDTARDVYFGCLRLGYEVLREFIPQLVAQPQAGQPQSGLQSTYFGPKALDFANVVIDLRQTAFQIHNMVRAFCFQEYQLPLVLGQRVRGSRLTEVASTGKPGTVVADTATSLTISTMDFNLELLKDHSLALFEAVRAQDAVATADLAPRLPSLEVATRQGWTPLMVAAYGGSPAVVAALLAAGAAPNTATRQGTTPLMYAKTTAARTHDLRVVDLLLAHGANPAARDQTGQSVLDYARLEGSPAVVARLEQALTA